MRLPPALFALPFAAALHAAPIFLEAEDFTASVGWTVKSSGETRRASATRTLSGADGPGDATAAKTITLPEAGRWRVWVRFIETRWRGPFRLSVSAGGHEVAGQVFDLAPIAGVADFDYTWQSFDAELPAGDITLTLAKHEQKNCSGYARHVDCVLLTQDPALVPNHVDFGPQTWVRVTVGEGYERPVYLHVFADHARAPWYQHLAVGKDNVFTALAPPAGQLLASGERSAWCNLTHTIYQDSGATLNLSARHTYHDKPARMRMRIDFASAPEDAAIVRSIDADCTPNGLVVIAPPNLATPENRARLKTDREIAEETGRIADSFDWPKHGHPPGRFPFLVSASIGETPVVDARVREREEKTLSYFGFSGTRAGVLHSRTWRMKDGSYCAPDIERIRAAAAEMAKELQSSGRALNDVPAIMLTDEPSAQSAAFHAKDPTSIEAFRAWLREQKLEPKDLLVADWDAVRPIAETERDRFPALHYYTQRFRTHALGKFMTTQRRALDEALGGSRPVLANFSDGAVFHGSFNPLGIDYFELLDDPAQNGFWSEDWSNLASTYQCAAWNYAVAQAAARKHGQTLGNYLVAHAGRTGWDVKTKAASVLARGVKILTNFHYGPSWASHEGGAAWKSHLWYSHPDTWRANAEITREVGAAEDLLLAAQPAPSEVAIVYSSTTDIWTPDNFAWGFDRMHTWLALAHAQIRADIVSERDVAAGVLKGHRVCYLSGPNLKRDAADQLLAWVRDGGTLWLTAGAAARDEFNRPLSEFEAALPAVRQPAEELEKFQGAGAGICRLKVRDEAMWEQHRMEVLAVRQALAARDGGKVLAQFRDGSPATITGEVGRGRIIVAGFLPALDYAAKAERARASLDEKSADAELLRRSLNPWAFPEPTRHFLLAPVRSAAIHPPLECDMPLVDAVLMTAPGGFVVPLANYTLRPLDRVTLRIHSAGEIKRAESARLGSIPFTRGDDGMVTISLPLEASDFVQLFR